MQNQFVLQHINKIPNRPEGKNSWHCLFKIYSTTQNIGLVASDQWRLCHRATYFRSSGVCDSASVPLFQPHTNAGRREKMRRLNMYCHLPPPPNGARFLMQIVCYYLVQLHFTFYLRRSPSRPYLLYTFACLSTFLAMCQALGGGTRG